MKQTTQTTQRPRWNGLATRTAASALVLSTVFAGFGAALPAYADFADGRSGPGRDHRQGQRRTARTPSSSWTRPPTRA